MSKLIHIPESALKSLLREAGHPESVEDYLRSTEVQLAAQAGRRFLSRARVAYWSRFWLFFSALVTWFFYLLGPNWEGFVSGALLTGMTIVEFRVHALFLEGDPLASVYGWWNQCLFALLFVIYGAYHGTFVSVSPDIRDTIDPGMFPLLVNLEKLFYYTIALVGGLGQFYLACYYRSARK